MNGANFLTCSQGLNCRGTREVRSDVSILKGSLLSWIQVFLTKRTQRVALESVLSNQCFLTSGVSQGTVLGLLLFLIYINDLPLCISSTMRLFTDDCFLYRSINSPVGCQNIQKDLDALTKWEKD